MAIATKLPAKPRRENVKRGENLCQYCAAKCCRYLALEIDTPTDWDDFEYIRWYLLHERVAVFTEDGTWYLLVQNKCKMLRDDNLCAAYQTRPKICRGYTTHKCEYEDEWVYDHYWETPEQVLEYAEAVWGPRRGKNLRSPRPDPPAVIRRPK